MKKKPLLAAFLSFLLIIVIAGCSNSQNSSQTNGSANNTGNSSNASVNGFGTPDIYGEVSSVAGNKVTLKLMKVPQRPARNGQGNGQGGGNWQNRQNGSNGGFRGGGYGGMRQKEYTGQTKTIVISSGTSLVTITRGANGMAESNIGMNQVTVGSILSVYYKEDGKTIDKIRVMHPGSFGGQGNGSGNGSSNGQSTSGV